MKNTLIIMLLSTCLLSSCSSDDGGSNYAYTAPIINPSFEDLGDNPDGYQADGWIREGMNDWSASTLGVKRITGASFMPTDGQYFLEFPASDKGAPIFPGSYPLLLAYQDDVNLSRATDFFFDYEVSNVSILAGSGTFGYDGAANVTIYFQPNEGGSGTVVLWSKNFAPGAATEQVLNMSVPVPADLGKGRLTIEVSADASRQESINSATTLTFRIDYLSF